MRLALNPRGAGPSRLSPGRLRGRLPRLTAFSALELLLLSLIAIQAARLFWIQVTPVGPVGDWKAPGALAALPGAGSALTGFDPFFRLSGAGGPAVVTALDLKLFGVREDRATGRGSAIIALPDGSQQSFAVGDEIMPDVTLTEVAFDSVTISRGGTPEQIFLDQSSPAETVGGAEAAPTATTAPAPAPAPGQTQPPPAPAAPPTPGQPIQFQPRVSGGRVSGVVVSPGGDGQAFRRAGFAPGDVIVSVNGQRVSSMEQARALMRQSGDVNVVVDRGGRAVPMRVRLDR